MTREEAIKWMEETIQDAEGLLDKCSPALKEEVLEQNEVFKIAISALRSVSREQELEAENKGLEERIVNWWKYMAPTREQVEKAWRGEWLNFYNDFSTAECSKCGELFEVSPDETPKEEFFKAFKEFYHFCPSCGASMTDEAVQMVMERLEALYE